MLLDSGIRRGSDVIKAVAGSAGRSVGARMSTALQRLARRV